MLEPAVSQVAIPMEADGRDFTLLAPVGYSDVSSTREMSSCREWTPHFEYTFWR